MTTEERLKELGFTPNYLPTDENDNRVVDQYEYEKGNILIGRTKDGFYVFVYASITHSLDYAREVLGVKTEIDLLKLCELVDG